MIVYRSVESATVNRTHLDTEVEALWRHWNPVHHPSENSCGASGRHSGKPHVLHSGHAPVSPRGSRIHGDTLRRLQWVAWTWGISCIAVKFTLQLNVISVTKFNHHEMPKTRTSGFLPQIDQTYSDRSSAQYKPVTLEVSHGKEKQVISLPTDRLDKNKRYYVTFTIKGGPPLEEESKTTPERMLRHRHAKSL